MAKYLHFGNRDEVDSLLLVSRKAIVAYHRRLEEVGVRASGQQSKLNCLLLVADYLLQQLEVENA